MRYFLPLFVAAAWLPHAEGPARFVILGLFMGLVCLMLRDLA